MKTLYKHQQKFIEKDPDKALLVWEAGLGKTIAGCEWLKSNHRPNGRRLVVCPKAVKEKWKRELIEWKASLNVDVVSRDEVKKMDLNKYCILVIDECQDFSAPLFEKGRSARATTIYNFVKDNPNAHILLLSATPVRSTPWNAHTLACYLGKYWSQKLFRAEFFYMSNMYGRYHYEKKADWRINIRKYVESISDIVLMEECFDVPLQHERGVSVPWTPTQEKALKEASAESELAEWHLRHRAENGSEKFKVLEGLLSGVRKAVIVCHYRDQIDNYVKWIGNDRQVFVLHGGVKDQDAVIQQAQNSDDCIFIVQAQMSSGFDADKFSVMIFASMSFSYVNFQQMKGRIKRSHNLHENFYIYLLGGKCDNAVYEQVIAGKDFDPISYLAGTSDSPQEA